jgi:signal transduction histidine kinase/CheY-like chemotaxis protein
MRENAGEKKLSLSFQSAKSKVIAGFVLAGAALVLFWVGNRLVFGAAMHNIQELSRPNHKLVQVHELFQEFTRTDQLQRRIAVEEKRDRREKIEALSDTLQTRIEALKQLYREEDAQYLRLDSIQMVMEKRSRLFWNFIQERDRLLSNTVLAEQARSISEWVADSDPLVDSTLQTQTYRQVTTTSIPPDTLIKIIAIERQGGVFNRLFGKKKPTELEETFIPAEPEIRVEETVDSVVSNLNITQRDTVLPLLEERLREMVQSQQTQITRVAWSELAFLRSGQALTNEIRFLLYDIEEEELHNIEADQQALAELVSRNFSIFNWLLIGILLSLAFLIYLILTDFSNSRRYRAQLVQARNEAERLSRVKERFLSNMSHEIRTPLQSIIGYAEQIQKTAHPADDDKQAIHQSAQHLLQIVNEILDYNRLVSGHFQLDARPFDPAAVLREVGAALKVQAENKGLEFVARFDAAPEGLLLGDAFRLRQILYNLLGNAIKFTHKGRVCLSANCEQDDEGYLLQFRVEDTGIGMSEEDLKHVFNQFEQAPGLNHERYGGTGLGLSIVKALVEIQGGAMQVESTAGAGSQFSVSIPYPKAAASVLAVESEARPAVAPVAGRIGTVYVIDDDAYTLRLCRQILRSARFKVAAYSSPAALLEAAAPEAGDVVLTDIRLPGISGYQLLEQLRATVPQLTVIAMTAQALPEERQTMRQAGFDEILVKPFTADELTAVAARFTQPEAPAEPLLEEEDGLKDLFATETGKDLAALRTALDADYATAAAELLHRLAGRCGQFGFMDWYQALRRLEIGLRSEGNLTTLRPDIEAICNEIAGVAKEENIRSTRNLRRFEER